MQAQIDLEMQKKITTWQALQIPSVRKRFILGFMTMLGTQCSGLIVLLSRYLLTFSLTSWLTFIFSIFTSDLCRPWV